jgi:hypothetical protein
MTPEDNPDTETQGWDGFTAPDLALFEQLAQGAVAGSGCLAGAGHIPLDIGARLIAALDSSR